MGDDVLREIRERWERGAAARTSPMNPAERFNLHMALKATEARLLRRSCESLIGICTGLIADGVLNDDEIRFLDLWLADNESLCTTWPGEAIWKQVEQVLKDGTVTPEEREHLHHVLGQLIGAPLEETGASSGVATKLPVNPEAVVVIPDKSFCFSGEFIFGTRRRCEAAVMERNGSVRGRVTLDLDYLVIGTMTSREWAHTSFGRKIEKAVDYRARGSRIEIVGESQWVRSLA